LAPLIISHRLQLPSIDQSLRIAMTPSFVSKLMLVVSLTPGVYFRRHRKLKTGDTPLFNIDPQSINVGGAVINAVLVRANDERKFSFTLTGEGLKQVKKDLIQFIQA
jgi:hypothetical protein